MTIKSSVLAVLLMTTLAQHAQAAPGAGGDEDVAVAMPPPVDDPGPDRSADDGAGKTELELRYRFEYVDDDATTFAARASTLRAALGYRTRSFHGFSATGRLAAVGVLGPAFYRVPTSPTQDNMAYPTVADPTGVMVDEAYAKYEASWLTIKLGRQELAFNDSRFLGSAPWRQVHQTFDAASVAVTPAAGVRIQYALTGRVNLVNGRDAMEGQQFVLGHLLNATYERPGLGSIAAYELHLDYLMDPASSTNTVGVRVEGPLQLDDDWSLLYAAEVARQTDAASNPNPFTASYYLAEAGASFRGISARVQYNVRDGRGAMDKLSTPLAQPWDGWSEKFAITPDAGLRTTLLAVTGAVPMVRGLSVSAAFYDYAAQSTNAHYGRGQDVGVEYRLLGIDRHWTAGGRLSRYEADELFADTLRTSVYTTYDF